MTRNRRGLVTSAIANVAAPGVGPALSWHSPAGRDPPPVPVPVPVPVPIPAASPPTTDITNRRFGWPGPRLHDGREGQAMMGQCDFSWLTGGADAPGLSKQTPLVLLSKLVDMKELIS